MSNNSFSLEFRLINLENIYLSRLIFSDLNEKYKERRYSVIYYRLLTARGGAEVTVTIYCGCYMYAGLTNRYPVRGCGR